MGLVERLNCMLFVKEIKKLKQRLFNNPELRARQLYEFLRAQSPEVIEYLQAYITDLPLTKSLKPDYSTGGID